MQLRPQRCVQIKDTPPPRHPKCRHQGHPLRCQQWTDLELTACSGLDAYPGAELDAALSSPAASHFLSRGWLEGVTEDTPSRARWGACSVGFCDGLGKFAVFGPARSRSYAKLIIYNCCYELPAFFIQNGLYQNHLQVPSAIPCRRRGKKIQRLPGAAGLWLATRCRFSHNTSQS